MKKIFLTIMLISITQIIYCQTDDWKFQVRQFVEIASTPADASEYSWQYLQNDFQGIQINLAPDGNDVNIYVEAGNAKIDFNHWITAGGDASHLLFYLAINVNNTGFVELYEGSAVLNYVWDCSNVFDQEGTYSLTVKFIDLAVIYYRNYNIIVVPESSKLFRDQYLNTMRVWESQNSNSIPIVLSSGFDAYNIKPEQYYRSAGKDLFNCLLENGYDIYVVYYRFNPQDLRNNAAVFSSAINYVSNNYYNGQDVIAAGISMGGLISRYALAKAENDGSPLPVNTWISLDAPHQGAIISEDLQTYLKKQMKNAPFDRYALENDAAKIMLTKNVYDEQGSMRSAFQNELLSLNGDGFPHLTNNIGVSFSTEAPNPNSGVWLEIDPPILPPESFVLSPEEKVAGSFLPAMNSERYTIRILGGIWWGTVTITQLNDPTFISHKSSLDYSNSYTTKFSETILPFSTYYHGEVPFEIIEPLITALKFPRDIFIQNVDLSGNIEFSARNSITAGKDINANQPPGDVNILANSNVVFKAGSLIQLKNGFNAKNNFLAKIEDPETIICATENQLLNKSSTSVQDENYHSIEVKVEDELSFIPDPDIDFFADEKAEIRMYPNPILDRLLLVFVGIKDIQANISIFDGVGQIVMNKTIDYSGHNSFDVSWLPSGTYVVKTITNKSIYTHRFIKL